MNKFEDQSGLQISNNGYESPHNEAPTLEAVRSIVDTMHDKLTPAERRQGVFDFISDISPLLLPVEVAELTLGDVTSRIGGDVKDRNGAAISLMELGQLAEFSRTHQL